MKSFSLSQQIQKRWRRKIRGNWLSHIYLEKTAVKIIWVLSDSTSNYVDVYLFN